MPFKNILSSEHKVVAVGVDKPLVFDKKIIALENGSLALAASKCEIPVIDLSLPVSDILKRCEILAIDIVIMSCYGRRLPEEIIRFAPLGCFNMHPSMLPEFRGPEPVFWQMKRGAGLGISWHQVTQDLDAGDIVIQQSVYVDDGADYQEVTARLAAKGAELLDQLLETTAKGELEMTPQDAGSASYQHYPQAQDFVIDTALSAQQNYNFMCATQAFGHLYSLQSNTYRFLLKDALDYDNNAHLDDFEVQGERLYIPCNEGVLIASCTDKISD